MTMLAALHHVTKTYGTGDAAIHVLRDCDLAIEPAETISIIGPSGSGKSTLLNLLGALDRPESGEVIVDGTNLATLDANALAHHRATKVGFIFQLHHLLPHCTVLENVLVPTLSQKGDRNALRSRAAELIEAVGLSHRLNHRPGELSGGERPRAAVARALINSPKLLLADEPTGSLDRTNAERLVELLVEINAREKAAVVMVTHAPGLAQKMGRVLELAGGKLREQAK